MTKRTELETYQTNLPPEVGPKVAKRMKNLGISKRSQYLRSLILSDIGIEIEEIRVGHPRKEVEE